MIETKDRQRQIPELLIAGFLFFICFSLYIHFLTAGFMTDANYVIVQNPIIKQPALYSQILTAGFFDAYKACSYFELNYYRPVVLFFFALDYRLWGLEPLGYNLANLIIHFFNAVLVYKLLFRMFREQMLGLLSGFLFCILPIHEWVVNYMVGRADLLQMFFSLLSLLAFHSFLEDKTMRSYLSSIIFFILAILSREFAVVLPLFIGAISFYFSRNIKKSFIFSSGFFGISLLYSVFRSYFSPVVVDISYSHMSISSLAEWFNIVIQYSFRFFIPWSLLSQCPSVFRNLFFEAITLAGGLFLLMPYFLKQEHQGKRNQILFGLCWVAMSMAPFYLTRKMFPLLGPYLSEHFLYFTSVGFVLILATVLLPFHRRFALAIFLFLSIYYMSITVSNNLYWRNANEQKLLNRVRQLELGKDYIISKQNLMKYEENEAAIKKIIAKLDRPVFKSIWVKRLGSIYRHHGQYHQAIAYYKEALRLNPRNIEANNELAVSYLETGDNAAGIFLLKKSLLMESQYDETYRILGIVAYQNGDYPLAVQYLKKGIFYNPDFKETWLYLAMANFFMKNEKEYSRAIEVMFHKFHDAPSVLKFVANELFEHRYFINVVRLLEGNQGLMIKDEDSSLLLAKSYFQLGEKEKAHKILERAVSFFPRNAEAMALLKYFNSY